MGVSVESGKFHSTMDKGIKRKPPRELTLEHGTWYICSNILTLYLCLLLSVFYCVLTISHLLSIVKLETQKGQKKGQAGS